MSIVIKNLYTGKYDTVGLHRLDPFDDRNYYTDNFISKNLNKTYEYDEHIPFYKILKSYYNEDENGDKIIDNNNENSEIVKYLESDSSDSYDYMCNDEKLLVKETKSEEEQTKSEEDETKSEEDNDKYTRYKFFYT